MYKVSPKRAIHLIGEVDVENITKLIGQVSELYDTDSDEWISLLITSPGGVVPIGFGFYDLVKTIMRPRIQTVALADTSSMAIPIFLAGEHRVVTPRTLLFFHEFRKSFDKETSWSLGDFREVVGSLEYSQKLYISIVAECSGGKLTEGDVFRLMKDEARVKPDEAVQMGLAHEIAE